MTTHPPTPEHLRVVALRDPRVERLGHRPGSPYVEATGSKWIFELPERCLQEGGGIGG